MCTRSMPMTRPTSCCRQSRPPGTTDGKKLVAAIRAIDYNGALGHIQFDAKGDVKESPYVVWKVEGGKFKQVK